MIRPFEPSVDERRRRVGSVARPEGDDGFSLIEVVVAIMLLSTVLVLTIGPTLTAFSTLRRAKVIDVAETVGEGRIEAVRQLAFASVGVSGIDPGGVLPATETVSLQGVDVDVATQVSWVGSSAVDPGFFPGGHDGIDGAVDPGLNYKWVEVTVTPVDRDVDPIVFSSAIAPPYRPGGDATTGTVIVQVRKHEPIGSPTAATDVPAVYLVSDLGWFPATSTDGLGTYIFDGVPAIAPTAKPYRIRLGTTLADVESPGAPTWRIHPSDLTSGTDRVWAAAERTQEHTLTVHQPVTLTVRIEGPRVPAGPSLPIGTATLVLGFEGRYAVYGPGAMTAPGEWVVTEFAGAPLVPGTFTVQVDAPGYTPYSGGAIDVPAGYPAVVDQVEIVPMTLAAAGTGERTYVITDGDGAPVRGALMRIEGGTYGPLVQVSDPEGRVRVNLPIGPAEAPTLSVEPPHGHEATVVTPGPVLGFGSETIVLPTPPGRGLLRISGAEDAYVTYLALGSGINWSEPLLTNVDGDSSAAVPAIAPSNRWMVRKVCWAGEVVVDEQIVTVTPVGTTVAMGGSPC